MQAVSVSVGLADVTFLDSSGIGVLFDQLPTTGLLAAFGLDEAAA